MSTRVRWSDIAKAARETSEALNGEDWVGASIKARVLLADLADEVERLRAENERLEAGRDEGSIHRQVAALHAEMTGGGKACDRCGGMLVHIRLKGYRCPRCDRWWRS